VAGRQGGVARQRHERVDLWMADRWARAVEDGLEPAGKRARAGVGDSGEHGRQREPPPSDEVGDQADPDDQQALHPPVREVDEELVERMPADVLIGLDDRSVPACDQER
jgi:hypothetical protein